MAIVGLPAMRRGSPGLVTNRLSDSRLERIARLIAEGGERGFKLHLQGSAGGQGSLRQGSAGEQNQSCDYS